MRSPVWLCPALSSNPFPLLCPHLILFFNSYLAVVHHLDTWQLLGARAAVGVVLAAVAKLALNAHSSSVTSKAA